jgi:hypothetical protein
MSLRASSIIWAAAIALSGATLAGCTLNNAEAPPLTGPSEFATSLSLSANPDAVAMGQSSTTAGQQSLVIVTVFDASGAPRPNQMVRFDTLVNGQLSSCGQLSNATQVTGSDGRASTVFTAPGTPPDCPNFNPNGSVTVRATPVGNDFENSGASARSVSIFMALPTVVNAVDGFVVDFTVTSLAGTRNFTFNGSSSHSPGHAIVHYAWRASDGWSESGPREQVDHDFGSPGTYVVTLTITDDIGQSGSKSTLLQVN